MSSPISQPTKTMRQLREERGWTQRELAERLEVDVGSIGKWERGGSRPRLRSLLRMARLFEVEVGEIAFGQGEERG